MEKLKSLQSFEESGNSIILSSKEMQNISGASTRTFYGEATCIKNRDDRMTRVDRDSYTEYSGWLIGMWYVA